MFPPFFQVHFHPVLVQKGKQVQWLAQSWHGLAVKGRSRATASDFETQPGVATSNHLGGGQVGQRDKRGVDLQWSMKVSPKEAFFIAWARGISSPKILFILLPCFIFLKILSLSEIILSICFNVHYLQLSPAPRLGPQVHFSQPILFA